MSFKSFKLNYFTYFFISCEFCVYNFLTLLFCSQNLHLKRNFPLKPIFKETYFKILDALLKRGELDLAQLKIGFYENFSGSTAKKIEK